MTEMNSLNRLRALGLPAVCAAVSLYIYPVCICVCVYARARACVFGRAPPVCAADRWVQTNTQPYTPYGLQLEKTHTFPIDNRQ